MPIAEEDDPAGGPRQDALSRLRVGRRIEPASNQRVAVRIDVANEVSPQLREVLARALGDLEHKRGGALLAATILGGGDQESLLERCVREQSLLVAHDDTGMIALALVPGDVLQALYVDPTHRRRGIGRALVNAAVGHRGRVLDAYALPGDRATKSLYESFGWKTRLLTMRGE